MREIEAALGVASIEQAHGIMRNCSASARTAPPSCGVHEQRPILREAGREWPGFEEIEMKKFAFALAAIGGLVAAVPATMETAAAAPVRVVVRHGYVRPPVHRRCVVVTRVVRGPHGVVRRVSERRCR